MLGAQMTAPPESSFERRNVCDAESSQLSFDVFGIHAKMITVRVVLFENRVFFNVVFKTINFCGWLVFKLKKLKKSENFLK